MILTYIYIYIYIGTQNYEKPIGRKSIQVELTSSSVPLNGQVGVGYIMSSLPDLWKIRNITMNSLKLFSFDAFTQSQWSHHDVVRIH